MTKAWILACVALGALASCTKARTQVMVGLATDLRARGELDEVVLTAWRLDDSGQKVEPPVIIQSWDLSTQLDLKYELPGSIGLYSPDGSEPRTQVLVEGRKNGARIVTRDAIFSLVKEATLFVRLTLVSQCMGVSGCSGDAVCVEGQCLPRRLDARRFPKFEVTQVDTLECAGPVAYIRSSTGDAMAVRSGGCPTGTFCQEGTCLATLPEDGLDLGVQPAGAWQAMPRASTTALQGITGVNVAGRVDLYAVGPGGLVRHFLDAAQPGVVTGAWTTEAVPTTVDLRAVWTAPNGDIWAVGDEGVVLRRNGSMLWSQPHPTTSGRRLTGIAGAGQRLYIIGHDGSGAVLLEGEFANGVLTESRPSVSFPPSSIVALANGDLVIVGDTQMARRRGTSWSALTVPTVALTAVTQRPDPEIVAVGSSGSIVHAVLDVDGNPGPFSIEPSGTSEQLLAVTHLGDTDELVAVGENGTILRSLQPGVWTQEQSPTTQAINAVWAEPSGATFAVTATGEVVRRLTIVTMPTLDGGGPPVDGGGPPVDGGGPPVDLPALVDLPASLDLPAPTDLSAMVDLSIVPPSDLASADLLTSPPDDLTPPPSDGGPPNGIAANHEVQWKIGNPVFTPNGTDVILDLQSGLQWDTTTTLQQDFPTAFAGCLASQPDGNGGFRLPTLQEALTIVQPGNLNAIDNSASGFPLYDSTFAPFLWTQTPIPTDPNQVFVVLVDGRIDALGRSTFAAAGTGHRFCVRPVDLPLNPSRYVPAAGATGDTITALDWDLGFSASKETFASAQALCVGVGKRMPTIKELASILDFAQASPYLQTPLFNIDGGDPVFWSSDAFADNDDGMFLDYTKGSIGREAKTATHWVRCVTEL